MSIPLEQILQGIGKLEAFRLKVNRSYDMYLSLGSLPATRFCFSFNNQNQDSYNLDFISSALFRLKHPRAIPYTVKSKKIEFSGISFINCEVVVDYEVSTLPIHISYPSTTEYLEVVALLTSLVKDTTAESALNLYLGKTNVN